MHRFKPVSGKVLRATLSSYVMMALYAVLLNMVGELMPPIMDEFSLSMSQGGLLQTIFNLSGIALLFVMLSFSDRIRKSKQVYSGFLLTSAALFAAGLFTNTYAMLLAAFALLGATTKVFDVSVNAFINDINKSGREFYFQMLHMAFGLGAVLGPVYASFMVERGFGWRPAVWVLGASYLIILAISIFSILRQPDEIDALPVRVADKKKGFRVLAKDPQLWILIICAGCFSAAYVGLVTWFPTYTEAIPADAGRLSGAMLSSYFAGYVISRGAASLILTLKNSRILIILTSLLGGISLGAAFIIGEVWALFFFLALSGCFTGATLPMIIFVACSLYPRNTGLVTTILYIGYSVFAMAVPPVMGIIGDLYGIGKAMPLPAILMISAGAFSFFLKKQDAQDNRSSAIL